MYMAVLPNHIVTCNPPYAGRVRSWSDDEAHLNFAIAQSAAEKGTSSEGLTDCATPYGEVRTSTGRASSERITLAFLGSSWLWM